MMMILVVMQCGSCWRTVGLIDFVCVVFRGTCWLKVLIDACAEECHFREHTFGVAQALILQWSRLAALGGGHQGCFLHVEIPLRTRSGIHYCPFDRAFRRSLQQRM